MKILSLEDYNHTIFMVNQLITKLITEHQNNQNIISLKQHLENLNIIQQNRKPESTQDTGKA